MDKSCYVIFICEVIDLPLTVHFWRTDFPFILCPIKSNIYVDCWGKEKKIFPNWIWSSPKKTSIEICRILHLNSELFSVAILRTKTRRQTQALPHIFTKTKENRDKDKQKFLLTCTLKTKTNSGKDEDKQKPSSTYSKAQ